MSFPRAGTAEPRTTASSAPNQAPHEGGVHRIEVRPRPGMPDARGEATLREAGSLGLNDGAPQRVETASVYLLEGELSPEQVQRLASELLADPVTEQVIIGASPAKAAATIEVHPLPGVMDPDAEAVKAAVRSMLGREVEVRTGRRYDMHGASPQAARAIAERLLANTVIHAIHERPYHPPSFPHGSPYELTVRTVSLRDLDDAALVKMSREAHLFLSLEEMKAIQAEYRALGRDPREIELETIAQTWSEHCVHKTMKATIRYRETGPDAESDDARVARRPRMAMRGRPGHETHADGSVTIHNLLKSTVAAATHELIAEGIDWCLSVFVDNAGVIAFDDEHAVCFKCETHNHPSAIEPYGGAATGIGGCIRDIIGTGLAAKPIAATDVFCVAHPDHFTTEITESTDKTNGKGFTDELGDSAQAPIQNPKPEIQNAPSAFSASSAVKLLPKGVLHPRRILTQVVAGVRDYGNRMGIPTLNGAVWFDDDYVANPLVFCGVIGVMPRDKIRGAAKAGDRIIAVGGRTGRDGIHGATFSSAELTDTHADEFSHAVQIGNAVTEKIMLDAILEARDALSPSLKGRGSAGGSRAATDGQPYERPSSTAQPLSAMEGASGALYHAITDCGAGGFSSAVGEMGRELGAIVDLERAPLKYAGLSPTEIWISEAQERMVLAVPPTNVEALQRICDRHGVEMCDLGVFGSQNAELVLQYAGTEVGRLSMEFLHEGLPETIREAAWEDKSTSPKVHRSTGVLQPHVGDVLLELLAHPNIASKHWIIRQYDHEVQGRTVIKPLIARDGEALAAGPSDAAVITPVLDSPRGLAIGNGLATGWKDDPYLMALAAIDECVRNLVCVGADPSRIAILDNFCWPSCSDPRNLGALVRAAEGCYDGAKAYRTPFISGKDSLNNQFTAEDGRTIQIPCTLLISGMGIVGDVRRCTTMDAKRAGDVLVIVGETDGRMGGSHYQMLAAPAVRDGALPAVDLARGPLAAQAVARAIAAGLVRSAHDCSEGGLLVAASEMAFAGDLGLRLDLTLQPASSANGDRTPLDVLARCFAETPSRYLLEVERRSVAALDRALRGVPFAIIGEFNDTRRLTLDEAGVDLDVATLRRTWMRPLDW